MFPTPEGSFSRGAHPPICCAWSGVFGICLFGSPLLLPCTLSSQTTRSCSMARLSCCAPKVQVRQDIVLMVPIPVVDIIVSPSQAVLHQIPRASERPAKYTVHSERALLPPRVSIEVNTSHGVGSHPELCTSHTAFRCNPAETCRDHRLMLFPEEVVLIQKLDRESFSCNTPTPTVPTNDRLWHGGNVQSSASTTFNISRRNIGAAKWERMTRKQRQIAMPFLKKRVRHLG